MNENKTENNSEPNDSINSTIDNQQDSFDESITAFVDTLRTLLEQKSVEPIETKQVSM